MLSCYQYAVPSTGLIQGANASGATAVLLDVVGVVTTGGSCTEGVRAERKIRVTLTRSTYLNYAYFTDVETQETAQYSPTLSSEFSSIPTAQQDATQYCSNYYYALSNGNAALLRANGTPAGGLGGATSDIRSRHASLGSFTNYTANNICTYTKFAGGDASTARAHLMSYSSTARRPSPVQ